MKKGKLSLLAVMLLSIFMLGSCELGGGFSSLGFTNSSNVTVYFEVPYNKNIHQVYLSFKNIFPLLA
jgi:hypothetical protein